MDFLCVSECFFFFTYEIKYNKNAIGIEVVFQCSNFYHTLDKLFLHKVPNRRGLHDKTGQKITSDWHGYDECNHSSLRVVMTYC